MKNVVAKGKWKAVPFKRDYNDDNSRFDGLIEFQELTDYVIEDSCIKLNSKKRKAEQTGKGESKKAKLDVEEIDNSKEDKKNKKKKRRKKSKSVKNEDKMETNDEHVPTVESTVESDVTTEVQPELPDKPSKKKQKKSKQKKLKADNETDKKEDEQKESEEVEECPLLVEVQEDKSNEEEYNVEGMFEWKQLHVPTEILRALKEKNFTSPTAIQYLALPSAIRDRMDIIGAAETGSGKTLAFGIPIVARLLEMQQQKEEEDEDVDEEPMEVDEAEMDVEEVDSDNKDDDNDNSNDEDDNDSDDNGDGDNDESIEINSEANNDEIQYHVEQMKKNFLKALIVTPTRELAIQIKDHIQAITKYTNIKSAVLVGGMAPEKQMRQLSKEPEIIIATPGRLWELIQQRESHVYMMDHLKFLVIDEVDRMMEKQHFEELGQILNHVHKKCLHKKQVFVFSATLTFVHSKPKRLTLKKKTKMMNLTVDQKLEYLKRKLHMSENLKVFDLTEGEQMMAQQLVERKVNCPADEKDMHLYYFLKSHPGRTIVFSNSKDCIRRLTSLANMLHCRPLPLHADMNQKQRLKNMDRFKANENGLLLATDVAARGLDIPDVQHVIHYQVPKTVENYVHRSGRTARSKKSGLSVTFISPEENSLFNKIMNSLKRDKDLPNMEISMPKYNSIVNIVKLARTLEKEKYRDKKQRNHKDWVAKMAKEADMIFNSDEDESDEDKVLENNLKKRKLETLQMELDEMMGITKPKRKGKKKSNKSKQTKNKEN